MTWALHMQQAWRGASGNVKHVNGRDRRTRAQQKKKHSKKSKRKEMKLFTTQVDA